MCIEAGTLGQGCKMRAGGGEEMRGGGGDDGEAGARRITRLCIFCLLSTSGGLCVCNVAAQEFKLLSYQSLLF